MRLVDANELKVDYIIASTATNTQCYRYISEEQVENAPTIDAIPVEWVKKWISKGLLGMDSLIDPEITIQVMLKCWEKENEIRTLE